MAKESEFISGICQQLLFNPKGGIEGALVKIKGAVVQVTVPPASAATFAQATGPGKRLRVLAVADKSAKTADAHHPVYQFESFADATGQATELAAVEPDNTTIKGTVAAVHFAKHGQANGVILESGEFIHLRPHGMLQAGLVIGAKVNALGTVRMTVLGTRLLEARLVNRIELS
jgi:hypothetical protein